jgi:hypothetical protein
LASTSNQNNNNSISAATNLSTTLLKIDLYSRKRDINHTLPHFNNISCNRIHRQNSLLLIKKMDNNKKESNYDENDLEDMAGAVAAASASQPIKILDDSLNLNSKNKFKIPQTSSSSSSSNSPRLLTNLPPWSTLRMTPIASHERNRRSTKDLVVVTTPTSFCTPSSFLFAKPPLELPSSPSNIQTNNHLISQSPKVLVSSHQLVVELCSHASQKLKLNENKTDEVIISDQEQKDDEILIDERIILNTNKRKERSPSSNQLLVQDLHEKQNNEAVMSVNKMVDCKKFFLDMNNKNDKVEINFSKNFERHNEEKSNEIDLEEKIKLDKLNQLKLLQKIPRKKIPLSSSPVSLI